jgi:hypothetical protein
MNDNMTVVATTTLVVVDLDTLGNDSVNAKPFFFALRWHLQAIFRKLYVELSSD